MKLTPLHISRELSYELYRNEIGEFFLNVLCGGVGLFEVTIKLNDVEVKKWQDRGVIYIDDLAYDIAKRHQEYLHRALPNFPLPPIR